MNKIKEVFQKILKFLSNLVDKINIAYFLVGFIIVVFVLFFIGAYLLFSDKGSVSVVEKPDLEVKTEVVVTDVPTVEEFVQEDIYVEDKLDEEIYNILLCGVDTRADDYNSLSDSMILASYNSVENTVKLVSFMRDSWAYIPNYGYSKLNAANAYGGIGLLVNTLNDNFNLDIQEYIQVNFNIFIEIVDAIGGIEMELDSSEVAYINGKMHTDDYIWDNDITEKEGIILLNGRQALWHCRNRSIGNGDFARVDRQKDFLEATLEKCMSMNITDLTKLLVSVKSDIVTNMDNMLMIDLAQNVLKEGMPTVEMYTIPYDDAFSYNTISGMSVITFKYAEVVPRLHSDLGYDTDFTDYEFNTYSIPVYTPTPTESDVESDEIEVEEVVEEDSSVSDSGTEGVLSDGTEVYVEPSFSIIEGEYVVEEIVEEEIIEEEIIEEIVDGVEEIVEEEIIEEIVDGVDTSYLGITSEVE